MARLLLLSILAIVLSACSGSDEKKPTVAAVFTPGSCEVGIFGTNQSFVAITRRDTTFRYSFSDGHWGEIDSSARVECGDGSLRIDGSTIIDGRPVQITNTMFKAQGATLAGQLLEPESANSATPLVVLAHGSEELGWIEAASYPYQLVGRGVSVFVYDKRGTGKSSGDYSQNFPQLADDLVAASQEAKRLAGSRFQRFGLLGFSQGGWIVPMAAERSDVDFIGIGYGLVVDILEEDAAQVALELREAGYGDEVIAAATEITDVTARLAVSQYQDGLEELDALRGRYGNKPWFSLIRGGFTGVILGLPTDQLRSKGIPMFDRLNIDWSIKPMDVLREVNVPQLWALAENDREAPISTTLSRLQTLRKDGKDISVFVFPNTDHGMWEYEQMPDGTRRYVRVTNRYYDLMADWAKGALQPPYATSIQR
ncbi:MAG: alpha/beta fold hydrolase [Pseudomonadota bacterium]